MVAQQARKPTVTPISPSAVAAAAQAVPDDDVLAGVIDALRTLADPTRARILYALTRGPLCVRDLALVAGVSESGVSHQLRVLRERHLVRSDRRGNVIVYTLDDHHIAVLFREAEYHADHVRQNLADHPYP